MISNGMQFDSGTIQILANFAKFLEVLSKPEVYQAVLKDAKEVLDRMDEATAKYKNLKVIEQAAAVAKNKEAEITTLAKEAAEAKKALIKEAEETAAGIKSKWDAYANELRAKAKAASEMDEKLRQLEDKLALANTDIEKRLAGVREKEMDLSEREKALQDKAAKLKSLLG